jgi:CheY-like chemotaxis protein
VVIAEDDVQACLALSSLLVDEGHEVSAAYDGQQALRLVLTLEPHAVVTDHLMPGLDGLNLIRLARQAGSEAFFILITGAAPDGAWKVADHVLGKPINLDRLFEVLERLPKKADADA